MANSKVSRVNKAFSKNFQKALSTITAGQWLSSSHFKFGEVVKIYFVNPALKLKTLDRKVGYSFRAHMITEVTDIPDTKEKKVQTREYIYAIGDNAGNTILEFHWHPKKINPSTLEMAVSSKTEKIIRTPHIHVYASNEYLQELRRKHIPSGRITFEDVVSFLVKELKVKPNRQDWEIVLAETRKLFNAGKTW